MNCNSNCLGEKVSSHCVVTHTKDTIFKEDNLTDLTKEISKKFTELYPLDLKYEKKSLDISDNSSQTEINQALTNEIGAIKLLLNDVVDVFSQSINLDLKTLTTDNISERPTLIEILQILVNKLNEINNQINS